ncbi:hypothetical protein ACSVH2_10335 [Flavobacterium sp. RSB2_4_14]|uniref:hypothetical protein n=1 Tax=Flavobacterium sp. RSB2_4_14 TaxID=3447665 RepID=UPI003F31EDF9
MKTKKSMLLLLAVVSITTGFAQDRTTVSAQNSDISDNLDLRAVASIFGDSRDLGDFERRLNDPKLQISNLDLNRDNQVDYLRVIESIEGNAHLIVIQSVLGRDQFQDVATVEVERDRFNRVQVQVVGDVYMYGNNYIYEPVYAYTPVIYNSFWVGNYTPYCSSWYWGFYPSYFYYWSPFPIFRYQTNIGYCINNYHHYNYVNYRRCEVAYNSYRGRRGNAYENRYPNRSFNHRNQNYENRYELDNSRRNQTAYTNTRNYANNTISIRGNSNPRTETQSIGTPRNYNANNNVRGNSNPRTETQSIETPRNFNANNNVRGNSNPRTDTQSIGTPRNYNANNNVRGNSNPRSVNQQNETTSNTIRNNNPRIVAYEGNPSRANSNSRSERTRNTETPRDNNYRNTPSRNSSSGEYSNQRMKTDRTEGNARGNKRG